jgi:hypothetical protein
MQHQEQRSQCLFCQHQVVAGVACDGLNGDCPYRAAYVAERPAERDVFAWQLSELAVAGEFDAVRGED